jgi:hypothetical protein
MKPIAVFYHSILCGPGLDSDHLFDLLSDQMFELVNSGLADAASKIFIGVNGDEDDRVAVQQIAPYKSTVMAFPHGQSEIPTMTFMQGWCKENPGWYVLYFHAKGATYPGNAAWNAWRTCMTRTVITGWRACVQKLDDGYDACGGHWLTPDKYQMIPQGQRYFGGNFLWTTSDYLNRLPPLCADSREARFEAEVLIGKCPGTPRIFDFTPHWPMQGCHA